MVSATQHGWWYKGRAYRVDKCFRPLSDPPTFSLRVPFFFPITPSPQHSVFPLSLIQRCSPAFLPPPISYWQSRPWPIANTPFLGTNENDISP